MATKARHKFRKGRKCIQMTAVLGGNAQKGFSGVSPDATICRASPLPWRTFEGMRVALLTNEYPPNIYGGAGVHIDHLSRELSRLCEVKVFCFGDQRVETGPLQVEGIGLNPVPSLDKRHESAYNALSRNLSMSASMQGFDIVHCHTWYTHFAGILARTAHQIPLVLTTHSLEPSRPWKAEQLGQGGYNLSCWIEGTAYRTADSVLAVSQGMSQDVQRFYGVDPSRVSIVHNGILLSECRTEADPEHLTSLGIDPARPFVLFVGRITRQKGIHHFLRAARHLDPEAQVVLAASAPDTKLMEEEVEEAVKFLKLTRSGVVWIREAVDRPRLASLYAGAAVFVCPSIYEPFGITNLEAMGSKTPVVASSVGGIPEIIVEGETGHLVAFTPVSETDPEPQSPEMFAKDLALRINALVRDPNKARRMGEAARERVEAKFSWSAIAQQTYDLYQAAIERHKAETRQS